MDHKLNQINKLKLPQEQDPISSCLRLIQVRKARSGFLMREFSYFGSSRASSKAGFQMLISFSSEQAALAGEVDGTKTGSIPVLGY